jgi:hypothetical protein
MFIPDKNGSRTAGIVACASSKLHRAKKVAALCLVPLILLLDVPRGQTSQSEKKESEPLTLRIRMANSTVCIGTQSITLLAEITNMSNEPVAVDPDGIWYAWYLIGKASDKDLKNEKDLGNGEFEVHGPPSRESVTDSVRIGPSRPLKNARILRPGERVRLKRKVDFGKPPLLTEEREFDINIVYGQFDETSFRGVRLFRGAVSSNEFRFSVKDCAQMPKKK